jgi:Protein of unknown function (DUF3592)
MILFPRQIFFRILWAVWLGACGCMIAVALAGYFPILWTKTQATVVDSYVEIRSGGHLTHSYSPRVEYDYSDGKENLHYNCLLLGGLSFSKASEAQKEVQKFKKGETIEIRYLTFCSSIATIYPGASITLWFFGLGGILFYGLVIISLNANAINARTKGGVVWSNRKHIP